MEREEGLVRIGGLWKFKDPDGKTYLSGPLNGMAMLLIYPNERKKPGSTAPDFYLYTKSSPPNPDFYVYEREGPPEPREGKGRNGRPKDGL